MRSRLLPYVLVSLAVLLLVSLGTARLMLSTVEQQVNRTSRLVALLLSELLVPSLERPQVAQTLRRVLQDVDFPIVVTDELGLPRAWHRIGVPPDRFTAEELQHPNRLKHDPDYLKILRTIARLKKLHAPVPIVARNRVVGYLYYGLPPIATFLQVLPFLLLVVGGLTFAGLMWAAHSFQDYTLKDFWASFAKGLAHQMGVPVSSLWGWLELLKASGADPQILAEMEKDLQRLSAILRRFSKIGGEERLEPVDLAQVVRETVDLARDRIVRNMEIRLSLPGRCTVRGDRELLSWALENLLKNAYEARRPEGGQISISLMCDRDEAVLRVSDNGKGIPREYLKLLFKRSFSTKERGWGVGLLLVRRIVEEIHGGKIRLVRSEPFVETTFELRFPR